MMAVVLYYDLLQNNKFCTQVLSLV